MTKIITSDDILGKDVVDIDGEILGVVQQLHIDKDTKQIVGILVDQGFMKPDLFIGHKFLKNLGVDSIFLNESPRPKLKGLKVFDSVGKELGFVSDVIEEGSVIRGILMKKHSLGKTYLIRHKYIKTIGFNILLRTTEKQTEILPVNKSDKGLEFLT